MRSSSCSLGLAAALLLLCAPAPRAQTRAFSSSCDRFEIDGNAFGTADGTADFVDEFSGTLAPNWAVLLGTAVETGGALVVRDPGVSVVLGAVPFEIST